MESERSACAPRSALRAKQQRSARPRYLSASKAVRAIGGCRRSRSSAVRRKEAGLWTGLPLASRTEWCLGPDLVRDGVLSLPGDAESGDVVPEIRPVGPDGAVRTDRDVGVVADEARVLAEPAAVGCDREPSLEPLACERGRAGGRRRRERVAVHAGLVGRPGAIVVDVTDPELPAGVDGGPRGDLILVAGVDRDGRG